MPETTSPPAAAPATAGEAVRGTLYWFAALLIVLGAGWGLWYFGWHLARKLKLVNPESDSRFVVLGIGVAISFVVFYLLERKFWLSRLSGLTVHPGANPIQSAAFYLVTGVPGMFVRTAVGAPPDQPKPNDPPPRTNAVREGFETIVFVVVLVFLLKQFVVEAFVIPTGSMAETLYGYQKMISCPECGYEFPLNASDEVEPSGGRKKRRIEGYCCPNCRFKTAFGPEFPSPAAGSGDRVLVHKVMQHLEKPRPGDVVVFKFPKEPQINYGAQNYIKRVWGVGGNTIAIWRGDLYVCKSLSFPPPPDTKPEDFWLDTFMYRNHEQALERFEESRKAGFPADGKGFELIRKSDDLALAMRRIVYDNDHQSTALAAKGVPPRWQAGTGDWTIDAKDLPKAFTHTGPSLGWVHYKHLVADWPTHDGSKPTYEERPVDNFVGYNAEWASHASEFFGGGFVLDRGSGDYRFWVGDLMLECRVKFADADATATLELSKGSNRFQAKFAGGKVTLTRTGPDGGELGTWDTPTITGPGTYDLRFANVDCRLRVWVDGTAVDLGAKAEYTPSTPVEFDPADTKKEGWTTKNDVVAPAGVGATGGVEVSRLRLWRDTFYINSGYAATTDATGTVATFYVQPEHYLCLGDNSAQSSDGREWGTVPERLMLGRAVFVFAPFLDANYLLKPRLDRVGFIK
jgi:signal peptidase I